MSGSYSPVLQEAKLLSGSVENNRRSCKPVKRVNTSVAKALQHKGSKYDPLTVQDLPVTRCSGRLVIPPLAFWANQRVLVCPTTKAVSIAQESENVLDLPALHFKSRNEILSEEESGCKIFCQFDKTSNKRCPGRPRKGTDVVVVEMEIENTDVIKDNQRIRSLQMPTRRRKCSTSSVDMACYSAQKRQKLNLKNCEDHHQPGGVSSIDRSRSPQVLPQQTSPANNRNSLTTIRKRSMKSDSTEETSESPRSQSSANIESDRNGTRLNKTMILQDPKVIRNSEKQKRHNSTHRHETLMNGKEEKRFDHELEGRKKLWSGLVTSPSDIAVLRNEITKETGRQKKIQLSSSPRVHSPSRSWCLYKDVCSKLSSMQLRPSEEILSAAEEPTQKRSKRNIIKDLGSRECVELVYTKSKHSGKVVVMRQDSKWRREQAKKDEASFLTNSPLLMQSFPPKPRPSLFPTSGDLSDDSNDSFEVNFFNSSDEKET